MSQELIVSTADLAVTITDLTTKANDLLAQADKAEIETQKNYETGTDYRKVVSGIRKRLEDKRKELVDPYGGRVRVINAEFKKVRDILDKADESVKTKMLLWYSAATADPGRERAQAQGSGGHCAGRRGGGRRVRRGSHIRSHPEHGSRDPGAGTQAGNRPR